MISADSCSLSSLNRSASSAAPSILPISSSLSFRAFLRPSISPVSSVLSSSSAAAFSFSMRRSARRFSDSARRSAPRNSPIFFDFLSNSRSYSSLSVWRLRFDRVSSSSLATSLILSMLFVVFWMLNCRSSIVTSISLTRAVKVSSWSALLVHSFLQLLDSFWYFSKFLVVSSSCASREAIFRCDSSSLVDQSAVCESTEPFKSV
mmetsp:Transcript_29556/g.62790  ORF Transcript_29556/g.62790 Transcript_29556/m.62790 type:complete len:205 (+) Transcript_29556:280-894(+)